MYFAERFGLLTRGTSTKSPKCFRLGTLLKTLACRLWSRGFGKGSVRTQAFLLLGLPKDCKIAIVYQSRIKRSWTALGNEKYTQPTMRSLSPTAFTTRALSQSPCFIDHRTRSAMNSAKGSIFMSMLARSSADR